MVMANTTYDILVDMLARLPEGAKGEIVDQEVHMMVPTGEMPGRAAMNIVLSLRQHEGKTPGRAVSDNVGFLVDLRNRGSFSPDAAWFTGPPGGMKFLRGAPTFAAEVRSEGDYGPAAERTMAAKRADYFAAGTLVVWEVDLLGPDTVRVYRAAAPTAPEVSRRGETADAEPAVPGWTLRVDELFA
jgi:Uma2 family endonuclease